MSLYIYVCVLVRVTGLAHTINGHSRETTATPCSMVTYQDNTRCITETEAVAFSQALEKLSCTL